MTTKYLFTLLIAALIFAVPTNAQTPPSQDSLPSINNVAISDNSPSDENLPAETEEIIVDEYDVLPDAVIKEAQIFEMYCKRRANLNRYHDCECWAATFLEERINLGPEATRNVILNNIQGQCIDATEAAGQQFNTCMGNVLLLPSGADPETYCTCFSNSFARIFESAKPSISPANLIKVETAAHTQCRNASSR